MSNAYNVQAPGDKITSVLKYNTITAALGRATDVGLYPEFPAAKIVYLQDAIHYVRHGHTGEMEQSNADATTAIEWALDNLTAGRDYMEKVVVKGDITFASQIDVPSYSIVEIQGIWTPSVDFAVPMIQNQDPGAGNTHIAVIGGFIDGDKASQTLENGNNLIQYTKCTYSDIINVRTINAPDSSFVLDTGSSHCRVIRCTALNSEDHAIYATSPDSEFIDNRLLTTTAGRGIMLNGAHRSIVMGNRCHGAATLDGMRVEGSDNVNIVGNICQSNTTHGIFLVSSTQCSLVSNQLMDNGQHGIYLYDSSWNTIGLNVVYNTSQTTNNTYDGIHLGGSGGTGSTRNRISGNMIRGSLAGNEYRYGIFEALADDNYNVIENNQIAQNQTDPGVVVVGANTEVDKRIMLPTALDLSGGATDLEIWQAGGVGAIVGYHILYTEASSGDAGVNVRIGRYQDGVALDDDYFDISVSEINEALGYSKWFETSDMTATVLAAGDTVTVGTAGGKAGLGEVMLILKIVEYGG